jgi:cation diffusion facilitator family transporter
VEGSFSIQNTRRVDRRGVSSDTARLYRRAGYIALAGNLALLLSKGLVAWISGSSAIYADAANSGSDVAYSVLMMAGLWLAIQPADDTHPHGHQRIEPMVSLAIGAMMTLAGIAAARSGFEAWRLGPRPILSIWALIIPVVTAALKLAMYYVVLRLARATVSSAILASAQDNLSDVLTSGVALVGVAASRLALPAADPIAALIVSLWILRNAFGVVRDALRQLTGGAPSRELDEAIIQAVSTLPGVRGIEQLITQFVGPKLWIDIHILADGRQPLDQTHTLSHAVRAALEALPEVDHAFVHVEPYEPSPSG